jgi:hypothetical protein
VTGLFIACPRFTDDFVSTAQGCIRIPRRVAARRKTQVAKHGQKAVVSYSGLLSEKALKTKN